MEREKLEKIQGTLELLTRKWWFLVLFILMGTMTPPIVTREFDPAKIGEIIGYILQNALINLVSPVYPVFKIIPIILVLALLQKGYARIA